MGGETGEQYGAWKRKKLCGAIQRSNQNPKLGGDWASTPSGHKLFSKWDKMEIKIGGISILQETICNEPFQLVSQTN